jgi:hypothetical protein
MHYALTYPIPSIPECSEALNAVVLRGLDKRSEQRFSSCSEFLQALRHAAAADSAAPPPATASLLELLPLLLRPMSHRAELMDAVRRNGVQVSITILGPSLTDGSWAAS